MNPLDTTQSVPLSLGEDGRIRLTGSRIDLDSIVYHFTSGATPEQIQDDFPSLALRDIYSVIAYYLEHTDEVNVYIQAQERDEESVRKVIEALPENAALRSRVQGRRARSK